MRKNNITLLLCFAVVFFLLFSGCAKDEPRRQLQKITLYKPILKSKASLLAELNSNPNQPVEKGGKIFIKGNYIFLNDVDKGIHIIDNSNPAKPVQTAFLKIPGNQDIIVKDNILYADMYSDLLTIDISNPKKVVLKNLTPGVFTGRMYENGNYFYDSSQVVVGWITKDTLVQNYYYPIDDCMACYLATSNNGTVPQSNTSQQGISGSMARMILMGNTIYAIAESHSLSVINISNSLKPKVDTSLSAGFDLETIFPFENKLFLGSKEGVYMFDVSNPGMPAPLGEFEHGRACDPVISDGNYAYVTLHEGTDCGGDANELDVIDIKDLQHPQLVKSYALTKPTGLSKDGDLLFVCDSNNFKIFDASKANDVKLLKQVAVTEPFDVIAYNHIALVVTKKGLYQFNYANLNNVNKLSYIPASF